MMEEASVSIRLNPFKGLAGPEGIPVPWSPYGRILADRPVFTLDPLFHAGCYYVQDSSAMYVGHVLRNCSASPRRRAIRVSIYAPRRGQNDRSGGVAAGGLRRRFTLVANEVMKAARAS